MNTGTDKTAKGNPDTYFLTTNDKYVLVIYTTQKADFVRKALEDLQKCFDKDKATQTSMISDAIYDAVDVYHADVINMSLGMDVSRTTRTLQLSIKYAINNQ